MALWNNESRDGIREIIGRGNDHILRMYDGNKMNQTINMELRVTQAKGRPRMRGMDDSRHDQAWSGGGNVPNQENMKEYGREPRFSAQLDKREETQTAGLKH